jgi:hypothetical protein
VTGLIIPEQDLNSFSLSQLTAMHNEFATALSMKVVKGFRTKPIALQRTASVIGVYKSRQGEPIPPEAQGGTIAISKKAAIKRNQSGLRSVQADGKIIKIIVDKNPKRANSKAAEKFAALMKFDGKSVEDFRNSEGKTPALDGEKGWPLIELRWAIKKKFAKLVEKA